MQFSVARFTGFGFNNVTPPSTEVLGYCRSSAARTVIAAKSTVSSYPARIILALALILSALSVTTAAQVGDYEGHPVAAVEVTCEGPAPDPTAQAEFQSHLKNVARDSYAAVKAH